MSLNKKKRLLILSAVVGAGHVRAAESLTQVASKKFGLKVDHVNFLDYVSPELSKLIEKIWYLMVKYTPLITKFTYESGKFNSNKWFKNLDNYLKLDFKKYRKLIEEYKPDIIISTHYLPAMIVSWMYKEMPINNGVVITDYTSHSMWVYPKNNRIFVACDQVIKELKKIGFKKENICVSGIPVRDVFLKPFNKNKLRKKLDLDLAKPTLLMMGGGDAVGPFVKILKSLSPYKKYFQLVVIAGKNKERQDNLKLKFNTFGFEGKVVGFVDNIDEYMKAADLLISKAGGLTTTEAITLGLPMLIVRPTPGQEDGNTDYLTKAKAGIYIKDIKEIGKIVNKVLKDPNKLKEMKRNSKNLAKPNASETIIKEMLNLP